MSERTWGFKSPLAHRGFLVNPSLSWDFALRAERTEVRGGESPSGRGGRSEARRGDEAGPPSTPRGSDLLAPANLPDAWSR
ncbi:MAG: hypothetical protein JWM85_121 [Acidimicrobiaceae bacterium]|nr:hypothetical protein [Acidimicrobiaceae bacterium]